MAAVIQFILLASMVPGMPLGATVIIRQQGDPPCPEGERCLSLSECLANSDTCFTSNTTLLFNPGDHYTDGIETFVIVEDLTNLTLAGTSNKVKIHCNTIVGFAFMRITNFLIMRLSFRGCGKPMPDILWIYFRQQTRGTHSALVLIEVENFQSINLEVTQSYGFGFLGYNVLGHSVVSHSSFTYSNFRVLARHQRNFHLCTSNQSTCAGGNAAFFFEELPCPTGELSYSLKIHHTSFKHGVNLHYENQHKPFTRNHGPSVLLAGGLSIVVSGSLYSVNVGIVNVSFDSNIGYGGANLAICISADHTKSQPNIVVSRSSIVNGNNGPGLFADKAFSGGLYFWYWNSRTFSYIEPGCPDSELPRPGDPSTLTILDSKFINNSALYGAAIYAVSNHRQRESLHVRLVMLLTNFTSNTGGSAIVYVEDTSYMTDRPALDVDFFKCHFEENHITLDNSYDRDSSQSVTQAVLSLRGLHPKLSESQNLIRDCVFEDNYGTGLSLEESIVQFIGEVIFEGNIGIHGGGISLVKDSWFILRIDNRESPVTLILRNNTAIYGGGIYYEDICLRCEEVPCFYNVYYSYRFINYYGVFLVTMVGNAAKLAGNSIYGGNLDKCFHISLDGISSTEVFDRVYYYPKDVSLTEISSDPQQVCFCENRKPVCGLMARNISVYPGALFFIEAVGVGQMNGTVPAVVVGKVLVGYTGVLQEQQHTQRLGIGCGNLTYRITTNMSYIELEMDVNFERKRFNSLPKSVAVTFKTCPVGFRLDPEFSSCDCIRFLRKKGVTCDIDTLKFQWQSPLWVGYSQNKIMVHENCPFDYCKQGAFSLLLPDSSAQCEFSRTGILCGQCKPGLSSVFGTSHCKKCSNNYLSLLIPIALAGFLLVALLIYCDLTVAKGTLNGLIFYANIVRVNHNIIFPSGESNILTVFIAWLNLDIGIETCFYDGMDEYGRTWLQFVFPVYVWVIVGIIIVACRYSSLAVRVTGSDSVAVLATLFLLSYTKIQRTVLTALSLTVIPSHDGHSSVVWLYDGNVPYVNGKHAALFLMAIFVAVTFILPFTLLVLFGPLLQSKCSHRLMKLKLTPILDAYQGPYKDKFRCWTGVMLVMRSFLLLSFSVNALGSPRLNMLLIVTSMIVLLGFVLTIGSVYKQLSVNVLDSFYIVNLAILAAWTEFNRQGGSNFKGNQAATSYTLVSVAFTVFLAILIYHASLQVKTFLHHHNISLPFRLRFRQSETPDRELLALQNEPPEPFVNPHVPTVTFVDVQAREPLLDSYPSS